MKLICNCPEWDKGMKEITSAQIFSSFQSAGPKYTSPPFSHCPWCGQELKPRDYFEKKTQENSRDRISWDQYFMKIAFLVAERSTCLRHHVGAVMVKDNQIMTTGYNGTMRGFPHCSDKGSCLRDELKIASGVDSHICWAVHAERNCIDQAARHGINVSGSTLYVTHSPCAYCIRDFVQLGVEKIIFYYKYPDSVIHEEIQKFIDSNPSMRFSVQEMKQMDLHGFRWLSGNRPSLSIRMFK
jgi:dCMP deaminase